MQVELFGELIDRQDIRAIINIQPSDFMLCDDGIQFIQRCYLSLTEFAGRVGNGGDGLHLVSILRCKRLSTPASSSQLLSAKDAQANRTEPISGWRRWTHGRRVVNASFPLARPIGQASLPFHIYVFPEFCQVQPQLGQREGCYPEFVTVTFDKSAKVF